MADTGTASPAGHQVTVTSTTVPDGTRFPTRIPPLPAPPSPLGPVLSLNRDLVLRTHRAVIVQLRDNMTIPLSWFWACPVGSQVATLDTAQSGCQ